jgi:nucleoside-diphosphate kinase
MHQRLRQLLGHTDPTRSPPGTIRGDLGDDSLTAAREQRRLVRNLVHASDDPDAARRDVGTWYRPAHHRAHALDFNRCAVILASRIALNAAWSRTLWTGSPPPGSWCPTAWS